MLGTLRTVVLPFSILVFLFHGNAHADKVDRLVKQLDSSTDYKIRLSAAVNLAKLEDERAVPALIRALKDKEKNVRGVAATSLGKLISGGTAPELRKRAEKALGKAVAADPSSFVRKQAQRALAAIAKIGSPSGGGIYVNVGAMSAKTKRSKAMRALMRKTVEKTFGKKASSMLTTWPGGKPPNARQLQKSKTKAFHVDGTLVSLSEEAKGSATIVSCKVSMLIATFPKKSMFGFLDGGAKVQTGSSAKSIQYAQDDCVAAVIEDLVARKIIPTIEMKSKGPPVQTRKSPRSSRRSARAKRRSRR